MQRVPVPRSPPSRVERGHATHSSARHLLSGAVVYLFKAKSSHAGARLSLRTPERSHFGDESASQSFVRGALSVSRGVSPRVAGQPPGPIVAIARRRAAANRP